MSDAVGVVLSCSSCGAKLEITTDIERFVCLHCGSQQIVRRGGGIISLQLLVSGIERVQLGTDKTAAELAIPRLTKEIAEAKEGLRIIENILATDVLQQPETDPMTAVLALIALGIAIWVFSLVGMAHIAVIVGVPLLLAFFVRIQLVHQGKIQQWQAKVTDIKASRAEAPLRRIAMLQSKLAENQQIANS